MLAATLLAIQLIHPHMSSHKAEKFAATIDMQAVVSGVDPLVFVSIIEHESKFDWSAVSDDKEDWGWLQVRARYYGGKKEWLLNPTVNLKAGTVVIKESIKLCTKHLGREPEMAEWYTCFAGQCGAAKSFCHPTTLSRTVASYRDCLSNAVFGAGDIAECQKLYPK